MKTDKTLFQRAQAVIDRHGTHAEDYTIAMMMHFLHKKDRDQASLWLQIGYAVDVLTRLDSAWHVH